MFATGVVTLIENEIKWLKTNKISIRATEQYKEE